jgi:hypothetical protein
MKWSLIVAVVIVLGAAAGGYYILHQREIRVEATAADRDKPDAAQGREEIGTYKDAKHPGFPGSEKKE